MKMALYKIWAALNLFVLSLFILDLTMPLSDAVCVKVYATSRQERVHSAVSLRRYYLQIEDEYLRIDKNLFNEMIQVDTACISKSKIFNQVAKIQSLNTNEEYSYNQLSLIDFVFILFVLSNVLFFFNKINRHIPSPLFLLLLGTICALLSVFYN